MRDVGARLAEGFSHPVVIGDRLSGGLAFESEVVGTVAVDEVGREVAIAIHHLHGVLELIVVAR